MTAKNFSVALNFLLEFTSDKSKLELLAKETERILKQSKPELEFDTTKFKKDLVQISEQVRQLGLSGEDLDIIFSAIGLNIDGDDAKKLISDLLKAGEDLDNLDLSELQKAFSGLSGEELDAVTRQLQDAIENFDANKFAEELEKMSEQYDKSVSEVTKNLATQKNALKQMEVSGQKGTDAYKKLKEEIAKSEQELKKLGVTGENSMSFTDRLIQFDRATQGIQQVASTLGMFTEGYVALDTATQKIRTLGGAASELAPKFKDISIQLSKEMPIAAQDIAGATYDALSAGINASEKDIQAFMEASGKLAVGGAETIGNSVNVLSSLLNAYGLQASETAKISDELFTTINLGKTTLPELSSTLSGVIPTAAAMGLEFKNVGASIALMTANGIPTAQAMTKLNALLVEMQKPGSDLSKILEGAGLSTKAMGERIKQGDFTGVLTDMKKAFDDAGKSATQAFSSVESGSAFNVLTKDLDKLTNTVSAFGGAAGTTQMAFEQMSDGIENRVNTFKNILQNMFLGFNDMFGPAFSQLVSSAQTLMPVIISLQGIASMIPEGSISRVKDLVLSIIQRLVPGLITQAAATETATAAQLKLNLAVLANPYILAAAAIAGLVVGLKLLSDAIRVTAQERAEQVAKEGQLIDSQIETAGKQKVLAQNSLQLAESFKKQGESAMKNKAMMTQLAKTYPGVISPTKSYTENLEALEKATQKTSDKLKVLDKNLLDLQNKKFDIEQKKIEIEVSVKKENLENELTGMMTDMSGMDWLKVVGGTFTLPIEVVTSVAQGEMPDFSSFEKMGAMITEFMFGTSTIRAKVEDQMQTYTDEMYKASNTEEIQQAGLKLQMAILNGDGAFEKLSEEQRVKLVENAEQLTQAQIKNFESQKEARQKYAKQFMDFGKSEAETVDLVSKRFKITKDEAQKVVEAQKKQVNEACKLDDKLQEVKQSFAEIKKAASEKFDSGVQEELNILKDLAAARKSGDKETVKSLSQRLTEQRKLNIMTDKELDSMVKLEEQVKKRYEQQTVTKKSALEIAKENIESNNKITEQEQKRYDLTIKREQIEQEREANSYDEYRITSNQFKLERERYEKSIQYLIDAQQIIKNDKGEWTASPTIKKIDQDEVNNILSELKQAVENTEIDFKAKSMKVTLDKQELERQVKIMDFEELKSKIEIGIEDVTKYDSIITYYKTRIKDITTEIENNNSIIKVKEESMKKEINSLGADARQEDIEGIKIKYESEINLLRKSNLEKREELNEYYSSQRESMDKIFEYRLSSLTESLEKESVKIKEKLDKESEILQKANEEFKTKFSITIDLDEENTFSSIESEKEKRLQSLEELGKGELAMFTDTEKQKEEIEKEYQEKRLKAEEEFRKKRIALEGMTKGIEIEQQRQSNITQYNLDLKNVTDRLLVYEEKRKELEKEGLKLTSEDTKEIENLKTQQDNIKKQIEENTNVYNIALTEGSEALQGIIGSMFSGAGDAAADSLRDYFSKVFGVLVAALEKEIQGVVVRLLLEWLGTSPEPFWIKMGLIPVMNATIGGAIRAITNPLIESILSFSTGGDITGRYDTPTLLQVGDASRLGGSNREWIFRDEQLQQTVQVAVASSNGELVREIKELRFLISSQQLETKLSGEDILLSLKRSQHRMNARRI